MLEILQGLFGGLSGGLDTLSQHNQQKIENAQKLRQIQVQEEQNRRQQQVAEFEEKKAAYEALVRGQEYDPTDSSITPLIGKFPLIKTSSGKLIRPLNVQEQKVDLENKLSRLNDQGREYFAQNPDALLDYDKAQRIMLSFGFKPTDAPKTLQSITAEAQAEFAPRAAVAAEDRASQERIAGGRNATDRYTAEVMAEGRANTLQGQMDRLLFSTQNKPIDEDEYTVWQYKWKRQNPQYYNEAIQKGMTPQQIDQAMRKLYVQSRQPLLQDQE